VALNLANILFQEDLADVVLVCLCQDEMYENSQASHHQEDDEEAKENTRGKRSEKIFAHRQILAASSEVFQTMLYGPFAEGQSREIIIPNISADIMKKLI